MKDIITTLKIIKMLSNGEFHSLEEFKKILNIDYITITNHISRICDWGLDVFTIHGKGYYLHYPLYLFNELEILEHLPGGRLSVLSVIDSTNQYLIERINELRCGDACIAEYQTKGRGRRGHQWFSSFGSNLCLSIYWYLEKGFKAIIGLSSMISIVMAEILQKQGIKGVRVKWPNDLYLNNRKLAGILVEIYGERRSTAHIVIGVGINLSISKNKEHEIHYTGIHLQDVGINVNRNKLVIEVIDKLRKAMKDFERWGLAPFLSSWKMLDNFYNRQVKLCIGKKEITGINRGINENGALLFEHKGKIKMYLNGELSLRDI